MRLRPSASIRWVPCPGSAPLEAQYPEAEESEPAREGTAIHEVSSECLKSWAEGKPRFASNFVGSAMSNGVIITEDMAGIAEFYISDVLKTCQKIGGLSQLFIEQTVAAPMIHPENVGTLDGAAGVANSERLYLWDLKAGWGIVEPRENYQLLNYAAGIFHTYYKSPADYPKSIELRIVQPQPHHRDGPVRSWVLTPDELLDVYIPHMARSAKDAHSLKPSRNPGKHCTHCKGRHACETLANAVGNIHGGVLDTAGLELDSGALSKEIQFLRDAADLIKARQTGLETQALAMIKQGETLPGWVAEASMGHRKWEGTPQQVIDYGKLAGVDLSAADVKTPAQAERAGMSKQLVNAFAKSKPGALKLVPFDSTKAEKVFNNDN